MTETMTEAQQASIDLFFELDYEKPDLPDGVERDRYDRPMILPPGGTEKIPYTRCSTLSGYVENKKGLHTWDTRHIAHGVGLDPDIAAKAASIQPLTGDRKKDSLSNKTLDECIEEARKVAGEHAGRDWGTAVHGFTEPGQEGNPRVPERMQNDVDSYWARMHEYGLRNVASEVFVANHELRVAGTFDDLYYSYAFGLTLGDKKTGKAKVHSHLIQLATYARAEVYDWETDTSSPIQSLVPGDPGKYPINPSVGFWVHIPKGEGVTKFVGLNLEVGWEAAKNAARVRDFQQRKHDLTFDAHEQLLNGALTEAAWEHLRAAQALEEFPAIAQAFQGVWTPQMTAYGRRRMVELGLVAA